MILLSNVDPGILAFVFIVVGLFGISIGGILGGIFGGSKPKTDSGAKYDDFLRTQQEQQRASEQRMQMLLMQQQKQAGGISPMILMIGGIAVVAMMFLPKMLGGR